MMERGVFEGQRTGRGREGIKPIAPLVKGLLIRVMQQPMMSSSMRNDVTGVTKVVQDKSCWGKTGQTMQGQQVVYLFLPRLSQPSRFDDQTDKSPFYHPPLR